MVDKEGLNLVRGTVEVLKGICTDPKCVRTGTGTGTGTGDVDVDTAHVRFEVSAGGPNPVPRYAIIVEMDCILNFQITPNRHIWINAIPIPDDATDVAVTANSDILIITDISLPST